MRILSIGERRSFNYQQELESAGHQLQPIENLSAIEKMHLAPSRDLLLLNTERVLDVHVNFISRLMGFSPITVIISAESINDQQLLALLDCGRITYSPKEITVNRLNAVIELARVRFKVANQTLDKIRALESQLASQPVIELAKHKLQAMGLNEQQAHVQLQKYAMQRGQSLACVAKTICK